MAISALSLCVIGWLNSTALCAQETRGPSQNPRSRQIALEWLELSEPLESHTLRVVPETRRFPREPDFGRRRVVRGRFGFGERTNEFTRFAWDQSANCLYVDLNGNGDLTDDAGTPWAGEFEGNSQFFPGVKLNLQNALGRRSYLVDLRLYAYAPAQVQAVCALRSLWQGRLELGQHAYQVGVVENPLATSAEVEARYLLIRPWEARSEPIRLNPGTPALVNWSRKVFVAGQAFSLAARHSDQDGSPRFWLEMQPEQLALGRLRPAGQYLYRLILKDPTGYTSVLDTPGPEESLPLGTYQSAEIWLRQGSGEAFYDGPMPIHIRRDSTLELEMGGPLTNLVTAQTSGEDLVLTYRLTGQRGLPYRMTTEDRANPPGWKILAEGRELASGKFAYG